MPSESLQAFRTRLSAGERTRIVGFGSSNTECFGFSAFRFNWLHWVDHAIRARYGRVHHTINTGIGGDTAGGMLSRFETDLALYQPHLAFLTVGGNDSFIANGIPPDEFRGNLRQLIERIRQIEHCILICQTYYSPDFERAPREQTERFPAFMDILREEARAGSALLLDHLKRWEPFRTGKPDTYRKLKHDNWHLNALGNAVFALDVLRFLGVELMEPQQTACAEALAIQRVMDEMAMVGP